MCIVVQTVALVLKVRVSHASTAIGLRVQAGPRFVGTMHASSSEVREVHHDNGAKKKARQKEKHVAHRVQIFSQKFSCDLKSTTTPAFCLKTIKELFQNGIPKVWFLIVNAFRVDHCS